MSYEWLRDAAYNVYSQGGEDGVLQAIFSVIGAANQWCVECGASDGLFFSNTRRLIEFGGWNSVQIEGDPLVFDRLKANSAPFPRAQCVNLKIDATHRLEDALSAAGAPHDIDLAVIDVDGQDYYVLNSLLRYRPRVIVIEFDPNADDDFLPPLGGEGQAGRGAIHRLANGRLFAPVYGNFCNLVCVRQPLDQLLLNPPAVR